jgi:hypothetical protein
MDIPVRMNLHVVFDTSAIYTKDPNRIFNNSAIQAIQESSNHPYLSIKWFLPKIVLYEIYYQNRERINNIYGSVKEANKILNIDLGVTLEQLTNATERTTNEEINRLGVQIHSVDWAVIDWERLIQDAVYRRPPFASGTSEKGFRDAIIIESYFQILSSLPIVGEKSCAIMVSSDNLLIQAINNRAIDDPRYNSPSSLDELRSIIAAFVSELDIALVNRLIPKANSIFFSPGSKESLYYTESILDLIIREYTSPLQVLLPGADFRSNFGPAIKPSRFVRKEGNRYIWANNIVFTSTAFKKTIINSSEKYIPIKPQLTIYPYQSSDIPPTYVSGTVKDHNIPNIFSIPSAGSLYIPPIQFESPELLGFPLPISVGATTFEVIWSTEVSKQETLTSPKIENISYINTEWS